MRRFEIIVVGAGPAGLSAAISAAEAGAKVLVIDENPNLGGQIYRQVPEPFRIDPENLSGDQFEGQKMIERARSLPIEFLSDTVVWGIFDGRQLSVVTAGKKGAELWAEKLILAPGAYERPVPFPGWTLPGVMTAGGVQNLLKLQWVVPGKRFLLVGTGPLQLVVASQLIRSGAHIVGIADAASLHGAWRCLHRLWGEWHILRQGAGYLWDIFKKGVPFLRSHAILRAEGNGQVERAVTCDIDENWHPIPGTERAWDVDTICVGYGFISSVELAALAGCRIRYEAKWGTWIPEHDDHMRTSVPGVYVAGDGAGLGGSIVAAHEGCIAGFNAAMELGYLSDRRTHPASSSYRRLQSLRKFRAVLDSIGEFRTGLYDVIQDDTIICRCEEVHYSEIKKAISAGAEHVNQIKGWTRTGMGLCQGRFCEVNMAHFVALATGKPREKYTVRPPCIPVPTEALAYDENG
jgi:thioredoxin reductase/bacterioferritin-associated ferredoxin